MITEGRVRGDWDLHSYRQCVLRKFYDEGYLQQTTYLPEQFCVIGQRLKLRVGYVWEDGWQVYLVGNNSLPFSKLPYFKRRREYTKWQLPEEENMVTDGTIEDDW